MKTTLYFATVVAILSCLGVATQPTYGQAFASRVAVIDVQYILKNYGPLKAKVEEVQRDLTAFRQWVEDQKKLIRLESSKLTQYKTGSPEYKQTEERIAEMQLRLRLDGAKREAALMEKEAKAYHTAYETMERVVTDTAVRNQIGLVLRFSRDKIDPTNSKAIMYNISRSVVFNNDSLDITKIVLDGMHRDIGISKNDINPSPRPAIPGRNY